MDSGTAFLKLYKAEVLCSRNTWKLPRDTGMWNTDTARNKPLGGQRLLRYFMGWNGFYVSAFPGAAFLSPQNLLQQPQKTWSVEPLGPDIVTTEGFSVSPA